MLSKQDNELLTRVGPGTPCGELMRRYWWPIAGSAQLLDNPVRSVRILGEDLTLYKDRQGRLGLIGQRCPHRLVDLKFGIPEQDGLRCPYHGWLFDQTGQCIEQPMEPAEYDFKSRIRTKGYPVEDLGGLIWAYLGPEPAPLLPRWDLFVWENTFRHIGATMVPCNWLQCQENALDSTHSLYLHGNFFRYILERQGEQSGQEADTSRMPFGMTRKPIKLAFEPYQYGIIKRRLREGQPETAGDWAVGHPMVFPSMVRLEGEIRYEFQIRVPIDDTTTWHLTYIVYAPGEAVTVPPQAVVPIFDVPIQDQNGEYVLDYVLGQDMVAWWSQGDVTDRSEEHLGWTDQGITKFRHMVMDQIERVREGEDPINVFRDPTENVCIDLAPGKPQPEESFGRSLFHTGFATDDADRFSPVLDQVLAIYEQAREVALASR